MGKKIFICFVLLLAIVLGSCGDSSKKVDVIDDMFLFNEVDNGELPYVVSSNVFDNYEQYQIYIGSVKSVPIKIYDEKYFDTTKKKATFKNLKEENLLEEYTNKLVVKTVNEMNAYCDKNGESLDIIYDKPSYDGLIHTLKVGESKEIVDANGDLLNPASYSDFKADGFTNEKALGNKNELFSFDDLNLDKISKSCYISVDKPGNYYYGSFVDCDVYLYVTLKYDKPYDNNKTIFEVKDISSLYSPIEGTFVKEAVAYQPAKDSIELNDTYLITEDFFKEADYDNIALYKDFTLSEDSFDFLFEIQPIDLEKARIMKYHGKEANVRIPEYIDGYQVTEIASEAFLDAKIKYVYLPDSIEIIGNGAFKNCKDLIKVEVGEGVKIIEDSAFLNCYRLSYIKLPGALEYLGYQTFDGDNRLCYQKINQNLYLPLSNGGLALIRPVNNMITSFDLDERTQVICGGAFTNCQEITDEKLVISSVKYIAPYTFKYTKIKEIEIQEGCTTICPYAFYGCDAERIALPDSITSIGKYAFSCSGLKEITIPNSITKIENYTFSECRRLSQVNLPSSIKEIGESAFSRNESLNNIDLPNSLTNIGEYAFWDCQNLSEIIIPGSVYYFGEGAFSRCCNLESVTIEDRVYKISEGAFSDCVKLSNIILGGDVKVIESGAFSNCINLKKIIIPESVNTIDRGAFYGCTRLVEVYNLSNISIDSYDDSCAGDYARTIHKSLDEESIIEVVGDYIFLDLDKPYLFQYLGDDKIITLPDSFQGQDYSIYPYAFVSSLIEEIIIPDSVKEIGAYAFSECSNLKTVILPLVLSCIEEGTFNHCTKLSQIILPETVTVIKDKAFSSCSSLLSITIPEGVTSIQGEAFYGCGRLFEVYNLSPSLSIEKKAKSNGYVGYYAKAIHNSLGDSIIETIDGCIFICDDNSEYYLIKYVGNASNLILPDNILGHNYSIYKGVFYNNTNLVSVTIPYGVKEIGDSAFDRCENLTNVEIPDSVTNIGRGAFAFCKNLTDAEIPDGVTNIGEGAFMGCSLSNAKIPSNITTINNQVFMGCKLKSIELHNNITSIGYSAFSNCTKLEEIILPNSVNTISGSAFRGCVKLKKIMIPDSVTYIGNSAFESCCELESITIPSSIQRIEDSTFRNCHNLRNVNLPNSIEYVGLFAFEACKSLRMIAIPENIKTIEFDAFAYCNNLTCIVLPKGLTNIGSGAFSYCPNLRNICFSGTEEEWNNINVEDNNKSLLEANLYYYSQSKQDEYWYFDNNLPKLW